MHRHLAIRTIAVAAVLLTASLGSARPTSAASFTDIGSSPYKADILWLVANGVTSGCSPTKFCPKDAVTREQMASFLVRLFDIPPTSTNYFTDDSSSSHHANINAIAKAGITTGCATKKFCPKSKVTREQMATFIARAADLSTGAGRNYFHDDNSSSHEDNIDRIAAAGIANGCATWTYCPKSMVTRGQMAAFLHRTEDPISPPPYPAGYDAVYSGNASGNSDVTSSLRSFLEGHDGDHVALAVNGVYLVDQLILTDLRNITIDFRGSRLQQDDDEPDHEVLRIREGKNVTLNDPRVSGAGYGWNSSWQNGHGIFIESGDGITLNHPITRDTRGDGIYISYRNGINSPAKDVLITAPSVQRASRSGIAPVAGQVTIRGGSVDQVGLHGINFEVNDSTGANSVVGVVDDVHVRRRGRHHRDRRHVVRRRGRWLHELEEEVDPGPERDRRPAHHDDPKYHQRDRPQQRLGQEHDRGFPRVEFGHVHQQREDHQEVAQAPRAPRSTVTVPDGRRVRRTRRRAITGRLIDRPASPCPVPR